MPTYDYQCKTCGHRFEHFQSMSSPALTTCPVEECANVNEQEKGHGEVKRIVSGGAGLVFKGEGFYITDYAKKGKETKKSAGKESTGSSSGSGSGSE